MGRGARNGGGSSERPRWDYFAAYDPEEQKAVQKLQVDENVKGSQQGAPQPKPKPPIAPPPTTPPQPIWPPPKTEKPPPFNLPKPKSLPPKKPPPPEGLRKQIQDWILNKRGQKVKGPEGGETCYDLVEKWLEEIEAWSERDIDVTEDDYRTWGGGKDDYRWGTHVKPGNPALPWNLWEMDNIRPGDIIQFRDVEVMSNYGSWLFSHHSAIVSSNEGKGNIEVVQQNVAGVPGGGAGVHTMTLDFKTMRGKIWVYRPIYKILDNNPPKL